MAKLNEADILNQLDFGKPKSTYSESVLTGVEQSVQAFILSAIEQVRSSLDESGRVASGRLKASFSPSFTISAGGVVAEVTASEYADFIDKGVDGLEVKHGSPYSFRTPYPSRKMADAIRSWIPERGVTLPAGYPSYESLSYAIATNVKKKGIKPAHFMSNFDIEVAKGVLEKAIGLSVTVTFRKIYGRND